MQTFSGIHDGGTLYGHPIAQGDHARRGEIPGRRGPRLFETDLADFVNIGKPLEYFEDAILP